MAMQKTGGDDAPENLNEMTPDQLMKFPKGVRFSRDRRFWVVAERVDSGPDKFVRIRCEDGGDDEVLEMRSLQDEALNNETFSFLKGKRPSPADYKDAAASETTETEDE